MTNGVRSDPCLPFPVSQLHSAQRSRNQVILFCEIPTALLKSVWFGNRKGSYTRNLLENAGKLQYRYLELQP